MQDLFNPYARFAQSIHIVSSIDSAELALKVRQIG